MIQRPSPWQAALAGLGGGLGTGFGQGFAQTLQEQLRAKQERQKLFDQMRATAVLNSTVTPANQVEAARVMSGEPVLPGLHDLMPGTTIGQALPVTGREAQLAHTSPQDYLTSLLQGGVSGGKIKEEAANRPRATPKPPNPKSFGVEFKRSQDTVKGQRKKFAFGSLTDQEGFSAAQMTHASLKRPLTMNELLSVTKAMGRPLSPQEVDELTHSE